MKYNSLSEYNITFAQLKKKTGKRRVVLEHRSWVIAMVSKWTLTT